jgi:chemotaxis-related protein WspB
MLYVLCRIGRDAYAISSGAVERVLPFAAIKALPGGVRGLTGLLNYQGTSIPVVDLCLLLAGTPARELAGTRLLLCPVEGLRNGRIALLVEHVSDVVRLNEEDFRPAGAAGDECLGGVANRSGELIQRIEVPQILPAEVLSSLDLSLEFT